MWLVNLAGNEGNMPSRKICLQKYAFSAGIVIFGTAELPKNAEND
jgi:hypothetical protein